jgi:hypothetical protein
MLFQKKELLVAAVLLFSGFAAGFSETNKYSYDSADPNSVVQAACKMIMNADYEEMVPITEMAEKKRTVDTVEQMKDNTIRERVKKESEKINGYELIRLELYTNDVKNIMAVVYTKWMVKIMGNQPKNDPNFIRIYESADPNAGRRKKTESDVYVDYLLKYYEGQWKIVSKRTR